LAKASQNFLIENSSFFALIAVIIPIMILMIKAASRSHMTFSTGESIEQIQVKIAIRIGFTVSIQK
jgi:hypothetical protein